MAQLERDAIIEALLREAEMLDKSDPDFEAKYKSWHLRTRNWIEGAFRRKEFCRRLQN